MVKETNRQFLLFGALFMASLAAVRCGGDDSAAGGTAGTSGAGTGGSSGSAGSSTGIAGTNAGAGGAGGTATGAGGTGGASGGAGGTGGTSAGAGGTAGSGGASVGDAGIKDAPVTDAGACPLTPPMEDAVCTMKQVCHYANADCACAKAAGGGDAGRAWTCATFDAGVVLDAGTCPATLMDGDACTTKGQRCPIGDAGGQCVCLKNMWNCP
jgi:hypothetical protein